MFKPITFITESRARNIQGCRFVEHMYVALNQYKVDKLRNSRYYGTIVRELNREQAELEIEKDAFTNLSTEDGKFVIPKDYQELKELAFKNGFKGKKTEKRETYENFLKKL